jgi:hypothetical protein
MDPNILARNWHMKFDDGNTGVVTLRPREPVTAQMVGRMFVPKAMIAYPPQTKLTGLDYNYPVFVEIGMAWQTIELGHPFAIEHEEHSNPFYASGKMLSSGSLLFDCQLVADDMFIGHTLFCEKEGKTYNGAGYPFQFMGSGEFIATL